MCKGEREREKERDGRQRDVSGANWISFTTCTCKTVLKRTVMNELHEC